MWAWIKECRFPWKWKKAEVFPDSIPRQTRKETGSRLPVSDPDLYWAFFPPPPPLFIWRESFINCTVLLMKLGGNKPPETGSWSAFPSVGPPVGLKSRVTQKHNGALSHVTTITQSVQISTYYGRKQPLCSWTFVHNRAKNVKRCTGCSAGHCVTISTRGNAI